MLHAIRERSKSIFVGIVLVLLTISFAFMGVQGYQTMVIDGSVAKVNGEPISQEDFQRKYSRYLNQMRLRFGDSFDRSAFDQPLIRRQFLDNLIQQELMFQVASDLGLDVAGERLRQEIQNVDAFKIDGQFNSELYVSLLGQQGMTPQSFQGQVRRDLLVGLLPTVLGDTAVALPSEVATYERLQNQTRDFDFIAFAATEFIDGVEVSEEDTAAYYDAHTDEFMNPETVTIEYLELDATQLSQDLAVDDGELRERYAAQQARFVVPERRLASHILIASEENADAETLKARRETAQELSSRARAGEDFSDLARENSEDPGSAGTGGDLGWVERDMMVSSFEDALFALDPGDISDPVHSVYGFHVIWLREVEAERGKSFDEVRDELAAEARDVAAERVFLDRQDLAYDRSLEDQGSLAAAAEAVSLALQTAGPFSRSGGDGIAANPAIISAAFSELVLEERNNSEPIAIGQNHVVILRVAERQRTQRKSLEDVREEIVRTLRGDRAREAARSAAEAALAVASAAGQIESDDNRELTRADAVGRVGSSYDRQLVAEVFKLPRPRETHRIFEVIPYGSDQFAVVALRAVNDPNVADSMDAARRENAIARITRAFGAGEVEAVQTALRRLADIVVDEQGLMPVL